MMTLATAPSLTRTQYRLARHYLTKLRTAAMTVHLGQASVPYALEMFDQEWEQIKYWQSQVSRRSPDDSDWSRLCIEYPLAGMQILSIRSPLADQIHWLEAGLEAAIRQHDSQAELAILFELGSVYYRLGLLDKSEQLASSLTKRAVEENDLLYVGRGTISLGKILEERGSYPAAVEDYQRALDIFRKVGARADEGITLGYLGAISLYSGGFQEALSYFQQHYELVKDERDITEVITALMAIGQSLIMLEDFSRAEPYLQRAVRLSRIYGAERLLGAGLIILGSWAGEQGQEELELVYYAEGIGVARAVGSQRDVIHGLSNEGLSRMLTGDFEGALISLEEGLELAKEVGIPRFVCNLQRNIADTYLGLNDPNAALPAIIESLSIARDLGSAFQTIKAMTSAIGYWQLIGRNKEAARWAGFLTTRQEPDLLLFTPICRRLETALGSEAYQQALEEGKALQLDELVAEILEKLALADQQPTA
jgi:tetratricopeptide (TPR) repeat protein